MPSKLQVYMQMADEAQRQITGSYQGWTSFLSTAARLYKYPYDEQVMIHAQRPDATACAEYDFWNEKMGRYVRRGSKGIALIDSSGEKPRLGYYLIDSSLGTLCALTTTNPTQEVNDKNGTPTIEKLVQRNPGETWHKWNDATIGDTIHYETTVIGQAGAQNYVVHNKMESSLTMDYSSIEIKVRGTVLTADKYDVVHENLDDGCTFEIRFSQAFCDTIVNNERIVITYSATLNDQAEICSDSNDNEVRLQYGEKNYTSWDRVKTYSYKVQIVKTTNDNKVLTGAEFKLYYASNDVQIPVYKVRNGVYRPVTDPQTQTAVNIEAGTPIIEGLDSGVYYLTEEVAPDGYNKIAGKSQFEVGNAATEGEGTEPQATVNLLAVLAEDNTVWTSGGVRVINQTGSVMPETGATGTMIFIAIGAVLALGGYIFLVSKKRLDAEMNG